MARNTLLSVVAANLRANAVGSALNGGYMRIYGGVIPQFADTPLNQNSVLLEWQFGNPAFGAAVLGQISVNAVQDAIALTTGDATFFRLLTSSGVVLVQDTVGDAELGGEWGLTLTTRHIVQNVRVPLLDLTYTEQT